MTDTPDYSKEITESMARAKELFTELEAQIPKVFEKNKSAARRARISLGSLKKLIVPLRSNIQEFIKTAK